MGPAMSTLNVRLPEDLEDQLAREAELAHKPRSELAREAIREYLEQVERNRFKRELSRAAHVIAQDPALRREAEAMAEEFLPLGKEPPEEEEGEPWWR